jgi:hypothetical protein
MILFPFKTCSFIFSCLSAVFFPSPCDSGLSHLPPSALSRASAEEEIRAIMARRRRPRSKFGQNGTYTETELTDEELDQMFADLEAHRQAHRLHVGGDDYSSLSATGSSAHRLLVHL